MSSARLLGGAILCFALGLWDLAALNIWGIPWGWPAIYERQSATGALSPHPNLLPTLPEAHAARAPEAGRRDENGVPERGSGLESRDVPMESPNVDESTLDPSTAAIVGEAEVALAGAEETSSAYQAPDTDTRVQIRASPEVSAANVGGTSAANSVGGDRSDDGNARSLGENPRRGAPETPKTEALEPHEPDPLAGFRQEETEDEEHASRGVHPGERETVAKESRGSQSMLTTPAATPGAQTAEQTILRSAASDTQAPLLLPASDLVVRFATADYALDAHAIATLQRVATVLRQRPEFDIRVEGHADRRGTPSYNQRLSERRAAAVASFLEQKGVAGERIEEAGFGFSVPVDSANNPRAWAKNRRVEIRITRGSL
jgi:outer membrane protein OmpA-like peptidoglycan-associated protein